MLIVGSAYSYAKSLHTQYKVNKKIDEMNGKPQTFALSTLDFAAGVKISGVKTQNGTSAGSINSDEVDYRLSRIVTKLRAGKRLSAGELEYLRKKDEGLYRKALKVERERVEYERELKKCKTKDDVDNLGMVRNAQYAASIKSAEAKNDIDTALEIEMRVNAVKNSHETFIKSEAYRKLPDNHREIAKTKARRGKSGRVCKKAQDESGQGEEAADGASVVVSVEDPEITIAEKEDELNENADDAEDLQTVSKTCENAAEKEAADRPMRQTMRKTRRA